MPGIDEKFKILSDEKVSSTLPNGHDFHGGHYTFTRRFEKMVTTFHQNGYQWSDELMGIYAKEGFLPFLIHHVTGIACKSSDRNTRYHGTYQDNDPRIAIRLQTHADQQLPQDKLGRLKSLVLMDANPEAQEIWQKLISNDDLFKLNVKAFERHPKISARHFLSRIHDEKLHNSLPILIKLYQKILNSPRLVALSSAYLKIRNLCEDIVRRDGYDGIDMDKFLAINARAAKLLSLSYNLIRYHALEIEQFIQQKQQQGVKVASLSGQDITQFSLTDIPLPLQQKLAELFPNDAPSVTTTEIEGLLINRQIGTLMKAPNISAATPAEFIDQQLSLGTKVIAPRDEIQTQPSAIDGPQPSNLTHDVSTNEANYPSPGNATAREETNRVIHQDDKTTRIINKIANTASQYNEAVTITANTMALETKAALEIALTNFQRQTVNPLQLKAQKNDRYQAAFRVAEALSHSLTELVTVASYRFERQTLLSHFQSAIAKARPVMVNLPQERQALKTLLDAAFLAVSVLTLGIANVVSKCISGSPRFFKTTSLPSKIGNQLDALNDKSQKQLDVDNNPQYRRA